MIPGEQPVTWRRSARERFADIVQGRAVAPVLGLCLAILIWRRPDAFGNPQFWAEEGMFFHTEVLWGTDALFVAYNGYYHTIPRLVAMFAARLDPALIPFTYMCGALVCTLYVAARTLSPRFPFPRHAGYALAVVLVPDAFEVLLNLTNIQSFLVVALVLVLVSRDPATNRQKIHDVVALLACGLTGPFSILLTPLFALRAWWRRTRWSAILAAVIGLTAAIQLYAFLNFPASVVNEGTARPELSAAAIGLRTAGSLWLRPWLPAPNTLALGIPLAVIVIGGIATIAVRAGPDRRERILMAGAIALLVAGALYRTRYTATDLTLWGVGARYFYPVQMLVLWLLLGLLGTSDKRWRIPAATLLGVFLVMAVPRLREPPLQDMHWGNYVDELRAGLPVDIPINPPGWTLPIPARRAP